MEVIQAPSLDFSFSEFNIPNYRRRAQFSNIQRRGKEAVGDPDCYLLLDSCSLVVNRTKQGPLSLLLLPPYGSATIY